MSAIDNIADVGIAALESLRADAKREAEPSCLHCDEALPSMRSVDAIGRLLTKQMQSETRLVMGGVDVEFWRRGYCDARCLQAHVDGKAERAGARRALRVLMPGGQR